MKNAIVWGLGLLIIAGWYFSSWFILLLVVVLFLLLPSHLDPAIRLKEWAHSKDEDRED